MYLQMYLETKKKQKRRKFFPLHPFYKEEIDKEERWEEQSQRDARINLCYQPLVPAIEPIMGPIMGPIHKEETEKKKRSPLASPF